MVIVGGGVMGSAVACWLAATPGFAGEIVVVERDPSYARASSALSASGIRQQFSTAVNVAIGAFGAAFLREADRHLGVGGEPAGLTFHEGGYLILATAAGAAILAANHAVQRAGGADIALLGPDELRGRFPWLATDDIAAGTLGMSGEGWFDGYALTRAFRRKAIAGGARFVHDTVTAIRRRGGAVAAAVLAGSGEIAADQLVIAAGPWSRALGAMAGVDIPVHAKRRTVFVLQCPEPPAPCPLVADPSGVWFRPEGRQFIAGCPPEDDAADDLPLEPEHALFEAVVWPAMAARVPAFERLRVLSAWAGYYEMNSFDHNGLVGRDPGAENLLLATGFSGHGVQQAPAVGRGLAELIVSGRYTSLDLSPLDPGRLGRGEPLVERNVI